MAPPESSLYDLSNNWIIIGGILRKALATLALSGLLLSGFTVPPAPPASAVPLGPSSEQVDTDHQISNLTLRIANDPRLLAIGYTNDIAHGGATVTANATAPGAERIEYFWVPAGHDAPTPDALDMGAVMTLDSGLWFDRAPVTIWARATWPDGEIRESSTRLDTGYVSGQAATFKAPASIRPGTMISGDIIQLGPLAKAAAEQGHVSIVWRAQSKANQGRLWNQAAKFGMGPLAIQPSWRGTSLILQVSIESPEGWNIESSSIRIPIEDVDPAPVKVSLPPFAMGLHRSFGAKITNLPAGSIQEVQWIHNGKIARDFTAHFGPHFAPETNLPGDTLQVKVRSVFPDGTITAPAVSNKVVLSTPAFKAPPTTLVGSPLVGQKLTAVRGEGYVPPKVKVTRQWLRDGKAIPGATGTTYKLGPADGNKKISVTTSYKPFDRAAVSSTSRATAKVKLLLMRIGVVETAGTAKPGRTLSARTAHWQKGAAFEYQWLRAGKPIKGATKPKYTVTKTDAGKRIALRATATLPGYKTVVKSSHSKLVAKR